MPDILERLTKVRAGKIAEAQRLSREGVCMAQIARVLRIDWNTARKYADPDFVPRPLRRRIYTPPGKQRSRSARYGGEVQREFPVDAEVAALRDAVVSAFRSGDMDAYASLSERLTRALDRWRESQRLRGTTTDILEAAE